MKNLFLRAALCALPCLMSAAHGAETRLWSQSRAADYEKAEIKGLALRSDGLLTLAPALKELHDASVPFLWAVAEDSKGNLYTAGGSPGGSTVKVLRIDAAGQVRDFMELDGLVIHALALDAQDRLYAATSPDGKIYRLDAAGKPQVFYDPKAKYIWAMRFSPAGELYAATGDQGEIHRVTPDGRGSVFFRLDESHARAMAIDSKGNLLLGTEPAGLVIRVSPRGEGFVLHQTSKREVTSIAAAADGRVFVAAAGTRQSQPLPAPPPVAVQPAAPMPPGVAPAKPAAPIPPTLAPAPAISGGAELIEIGSDGEPRRIWSSNQDTVYSLAIDASGRPWIGTGKGTIRRIDSPALSTLLATMPVGQVTALSFNRGGRLIAATGNVGKLFSLGPALEPRGTIESEVYDSGRFSYWGRLNLDETLNGGAIRMETRSGNLDRPQKNWSPWAALREGRAVSPAARFLQWRATFSSGTAPGSASPELAGVDVAALEKNVAPRIDEVEATPANYRFPAPTPSLLASSKSLTLPALGGRGRNLGGLSLDTSSSSVTLSYAKGSAGVRWASTDENRDDLVYKAEIKGVAEQSWKLLKDKISERFVTYDTTAFPDGNYVVRVTVSDAPSNPPAAALSAEAVSAPFLIDNTAPVIEKLSAQPAGGRVQLRFEARDASSWIAKAEYSINGVEWLVAEPSSKLSDSRELIYDLLLDRPQPGELTIAVRVTDEFDNQASAKVVVR